MQVPTYRALARPSFAASVVLSLIVHMLMWATPAKAQSLLQQLFGLSPSPQVHHAPRLTPPRQPVGSAPVRINLEPILARQREASRPAPPEGSGSYTTVCVRMCDGYHFPISHRAPRSRFHRDAEACRSRCGQADGRLFYHPTGSDMRSAVDLTGRAYARMAVAFMHRKRIVSGCTCRPEPWSEAALIRHEGYALAEGRAVPGGGTRSAGGLTIVAGNYPDRVAPMASSATTPAADGDAPAVAADTPAADSQQQAAAVDRGSAQPAIVVQRKPRGAQQAAARPAGPRKPAAPRTVAAPAPRKPGNVAMASAGKMVWPGDAPSRPR